jgi:hypothetical protein
MGRGLDCLLVVRFVYGMAAYSGESASVDIDAWVTIHDTRTGEALLHKRITSDRYFREPRTIQQVATNGAELFKADIAEAARALTTAITSEFGLEKIADVRNTIDSISMFSLTCDYPYRIEQDCSSLSGAGREVDIDGYLMLIAGSIDGRHVLLMGNCHSLIAPTAETTVDSHLYDNIKIYQQDTCLNAAKQKLAQVNINIIKTIRLLSGGQVAGYLLELDGDGYSVLKHFSTGRE